MASETDLTIGDYVVAEMVDCAPQAPEPQAAAPIPDPPCASAAERAAEATVEQTGADPPPAEAR